MSDYSERFAAASSLNGASAGPSPEETAALPLPSPQGAEPSLDKAVVPSDTGTPSPEVRSVLPSLQDARILIYDLPFRLRRSPNEDWSPNPGLAPSENNAQMIRQLKRWGYDVDWVTQRQQCLDYCDQHLPSALILMASTLTPDVLETCQTLVELLGDGGPPLLVLAPYKSSPHLINPILATGIAEYLPHPLSAELLVQRVDRLVHLYQATVDMRRQYKRERQLIERLLQTTAILNQTKDEVTKLSSTSDRLTQLPNRSGLEERLHQEWRRLARDYETLSVVTLTLDDFAQFKTLYGVTAGDQFLQDVASALRGTLQRPADFLARTGPDTFSAILPGTQHHGAMHVAKRLIQTVHGVAIPHLPHGSSLGSSTGSSEDAMSTQIVNVCAGVTTQIPDTNVSSFALLAMAEKALDEARAQGGDRAVYLPGPSSPTPPPERD